jgi:hypothetical protein
MLQLTGGHQETNEVLPPADLLRNCNRADLAQGPLSHKFPEFDWENRSIEGEFTAVQLCPSNGTL